MLLNKPPPPPPTPPDPCCMHASCAVLMSALVAAGMEEDGSFIGKYNPRRDEKSSLGATLV